MQTESCPQADFATVTEGWQCDFAFDLGRRVSDQPLLCADPMATSRDLVQKRFAFQGVDLAAQVVRNAGSKASQRELVRRQKPSIDC